MADQSDFQRYKAHLVENIDRYIQYKTDELREHLERVAFRYVQSVYLDVRRYVEQLVKDYQAELRGGK